MRLNEPVLRCTILEGDEIIHQAVHNETDNLFYSLCVSCLLNNTQTSDNFLRSISTRAITKVNNVFAALSFVTSVPFVMALKSQKQ